MSESQTDEDESVDYTAFIRMKAQKEALSISKIQMVESFRDPD